MLRAGVVPCCDVLYVVVGLVRPPLDGVRRARHVLGLVAHPGGGEGFGRSLPASRLFRSAGGGAARATAAWWMEEVEASPGRFAGFLGRRVLGGIEDRAWAAPNFALSGVGSAPHPSPRQRHGGRLRRFVGGYP